MSGKYRDQTSSTLNGDAPEHRAGTIAETRGRRKRRLHAADRQRRRRSRQNRNGALAADGWAEGPERAEIEDEEIEKEAVPLEEQEGIDDPVRMYLREIGKVYLLSGADEKRLARQMEEAKHIDAHREALAGRARAASPPDRKSSSPSSSSTTPHRSA